jgi:peptide/nickel transport system substrate-binding protein
VKKLIVILFAFIIVLAAGCSNASKTGGAAAGNSNGNQNLTYATTSDAVGLSPLKTNDSVSSHVIEQIYETLFTRDPNTMKIKPLLAESYSTPNDTTWDIKLRKGIKFQDGTSFNAEAVKYTFDKFRDPKTAAPRASLLQPVKG